MRYTHKKLLTAEPRQTVAASELYYQMKYLYASWLIKALAKGTALRYPAPDYGSFSTAFLIAGATTVPSSSIARITFA
jgi:hypothetical protein